MHDNISFWIEWIMLCILLKKDKSVTILTGFDMTLHLPWQSLSSMMFSGKRRRHWSLDRPRMKIPALEEVRSTWSMVLPLKVATRKTEIATLEALMKLCVLKQAKPGRGIHDMKS